MTLSTILHPTDCSESAARALEVAGRLATAHGATLVILHAELVHGDSSRERRAELDEYVASARGLLRSLAERRASSAQVAVEVVDARTYFAHEAIVEAAAKRHADVIVMGTHGRRGLSRALLGSNAERVLRQAPCHVLTVRADAAVPTGLEFRKLLVPVDFSECSRHALDCALALGAKDDAAIDVLHVIEPLPPMYHAARVWTRFEVDGELHARVDERLRSWAGDPPGVRYVAMEGRAAAEIARLADERQPDLIVVGITGDTAAPWLPVGSVTERVCRMANAPVLAIRPVHAGQRADEPST